MKTVNLLVGAIVMVPLMVLMIVLLPILLFWQPGIMAPVVSCLVDLGESITGVEAEE